MMQKELRFLVVVLLSVLLPSLGFSKKYIVGLKDSETMNQLVVSFSANTNNKVHELLKEIDAVVLNDLQDSEIELLKQSEEVLYVEEEIMHPTPKPISGFRLHEPWDFSLLNVEINGTVGAKTPWGITAVKAPEAWKSSQYGKGTRVLLVDTGIDRDHPAIKPNFEQGKDFVGDKQLPFDYADKIGHGTHVAGTAAGAMLSDGFTGVAPQAKILAARVCSMDGCSNISVAKGINWGVQQKVDVISLSLGGGQISATERSAIIAAEKAGITVVAASGNDGSAIVGYPAALPTVVAVGALNPDLTKANFSQWGPELDISAPGVSVVSSVPRGSATEAALFVNSSKTLSVIFEGGAEQNNPIKSQLVDAGLGRVEDIQKEKVIGKVALVKRGEISFPEKAKNLIKAGAIGMVVYNNEPGLFKGSISDSNERNPITAFLIEQTNGESLKNSILRGHTVNISMEFIASDYDSYDGTSMATPHVSGVVALIKAANPRLKANQIREIIKNTAQKMSYSSLNNEVGAGLVRADLCVNQAVNFQ